jgi:hypothetical protein
MPLVGLAERGQVPWAFSPRNVLRSPTVEVEVEVEVEVVAEVQIPTYVRDDASNPGGAGEAADQDLAPS